MAFTDKEFGTVLAEDGTKLRYVARRTESAKKVLVFVNGRTEWIEKYPDIPEWFGLSDDWGYLCWDHRGQGASGGTPSYIDRYETFASDARKIIADQCGQRPYVIVAHSMGSLVSLFGALTDQLHPQAMVLSSPLFLLPNKPLPRWFARPVARMLTFARMGRVGTGAGKHDRAAFIGNKLTHDEAAFERIMNTPYPVPSATYGWVNATFAATDYIFMSQNIAKLRCPTMVLTGDDERVVDVSGKYLWCEKAKSLRPDLGIESLTIPGARHEIFSEAPELRSQAVADIKRFLSKNSVL